MVYIEAKKIKGSVYYYHTRCVRQGSKIKKFRRYIGKEKQLAYNLDEFKLSIEKFAQEELNLIPQNYNTHLLTYSKNVINDIFKKNIIISNIREFDKNINSEIEKEFPIEFIYNSNNIEGSKLPLEEIRKIIQGKKTIHKNRNEVKEAENSIKAYEFLKKDFKFNMKSIKELHKILTKDLKDGDEPYHQGFKDIEIIVGKYDAETTHPDDVKLELKELLEWHNTHKKNTFPPELAFKFYFKYEKIHPFVDGNGRTGRFIMNKILMNNNFQPIIIYKKNKDSHINAFQKGRTTNIKYFLDFMFKKYRSNFSGDEFYGKYLSLNKITSQNTKN